MYIVLFPFVYVVYSITYVLNKDEIKILENYSDGIENYDKLKDKLPLQSVVKLDNDESVVQVTSMFTPPFDTQQRVDILTKQAKNIYSVYTIYYDKQFNSEPKYEKVELKGAERCTSLTYLNNQFVVDCTTESFLFVLQNGTQISYNNDQSLLFTQIQGLYGGILGLSPGYLTFFDEQLKIENQTLANYIQVLKDEKNVYLLNELQVIQYSQDDDDDIFYNHKCQNKPEFMTILDDTFYIQCGTLRKVHQNEIEVFQLKVSQLQATNRYIIVNNTSIFNKNFDSLFFVSDGQLYPVNYDDDVIQVVKNQISIGSIKGYYLIQQNEISSFKLSFDQFYVVDKGLQALTSGESDFYGSQYQVVNYVSGPNVVISDQGVINSPISWNIEKQISNKQLLTLINYLDESILFIYQQDQKLYSQKIEINDELKFEKEVLITQNVPPDIKNVQGAVVNNQIIVAYISQRSLFMYQGNVLLRQVDNVTTFQLQQSILVILNETQVTINQIINKQLQQQSIINVGCKMISMFSNEIALVDQKNNLLLVSNSNNGWYQSFSQAFTDKIININYVNSQLIVLTEKSAQIYENRILRGKLDLDKLVNGKYLQTQTHLYHYNNSQILQFQIYSELSLSSWPQQVFNYTIQQQFLVLTFNSYELLFLDNKLFAYSPILLFTPNTIVERDVYSRFTYVNVIFNNYQNNSVNVKVKIVGDILKLQTLSYNESDYQINNGTVEIDQALLFDGPISNIGTNPKDEFEIIQRVSKIQKQPSWINTGLTDLIYIGNNQKVAYLNSSLFLCSESNCQSIVNNTKDCLTLEQDQLQFYLVCSKSAYYGLKSKPEQIKNIDFTATSDQLISIKFDQGKKVGVISKSKSGTQFSIYINFKLNGKKVIDDLRDFQFSNDHIILLTSKQVMMVDDQLKEIYTYDLLENLISTEQNFALQFVEFSKIYEYKESQFIISCIDGPIYLIYFNKEYSELVLQFTNIQDSTPIETYLVEQQILVCIYEVKGYHYAVFYDFEDKSKSSLIIPYFNVVQLGSSFSQFHYTRQYNNNSIILVDSSNIKSIFDIHDYVKHYLKYIQLQIKSISSNKQLQDLIAYDLAFQQANINLKIDLTETDDANDDWMLTIYILCGILGVLVLLILFRYVRRYCLTRHLKFVEEKPSEFKSEYI